MKDYLKIDDGPFFAGGPNSIKSFYPDSSDFANKTFKYLNGDSCQLIFGQYSFGFRLEDGAVIAFHAGNNLVFAVFLDVNGAKGPNTFGKDVYMLQAAFDKSTGSYKLHPYGAPYTGTATKVMVGNVAEIPSTCKMNSTGMTCAYEIIKNRAYKIPKE